MSGAPDRDDPLERLAAEENWDDRVRAVEKDVARSRRRISRPRMRVVRHSGGSGPRRGISWIFLALLATVAVTGAMLWWEIGPAAYVLFVFVLAGWLVTLCLHEFAHALAAHRGGDDTIAGKGYLRLDPRKYGHPLLTLILPLFFLIIGGLPLPGGAVSVESHRLRNRFRDSLVSASGPAINIVAAAVLLAIVGVFGPVWIVNLDQPQAAFWSALTLLAYLQVATAILNLIPVPGLDGYGIIEPYLSDSARYTGSKIKPYGVLLLLVLLFLPPVRSVFGAACEFFLDAAAAPVNGVAYGYNLFRFWSSW